MKFLTFSLLVLSSITASANTICKDVVASGDREIAKICAQVSTDGSFKNINLFGPTGSDYKISLGITPKIRANKVCRAFGAASAESFKKSYCHAEGAALNLKGNYDSSTPFIYGTGECFDQLSCSF